MSTAPLLVILPPSSSVNQSSRLIWPEGQFLEKMNGNSVSLWSSTSAHLSSFLYLWVRNLAHGRAKFFKGLVYRHACRLLVGDTTQYSHKLHKLISGRTLVRSGLKDTVPSVMSPAQAQSRSVWYWVPFGLVLEGVVLIIKCTICSSHRHLVITLSS